MSQRIGHYLVSVSTSGGGSGDNLSGGVPSWDTDFVGQLIGIRIDYHASADAGTDVTISEPEGLQRTILTRTNSNTDGTFNPVFVATDTSGTALTAYTPFYVDSGNLKVAVAQAGGALTPAVTVYALILEED